jgi:ribonuclease HII
MSKGRKKYTIVGIDEAGRGPLAGPIAVAGVAAKNKNSKFLKGIKDSKKLSAKKREEWEKVLSASRRIECQSVLVSAKIIDKIGITKATKLAVARVLKKFSKNPDMVLLDGSLFAPNHYKQKTIIKGDEKIPLIAAASIIAKVRRDRFMLHLHKKFPCYCFNQHKGYGTKLHYKKLKKHGLSSFHRRSFLNI